MNRAQLTRCALLVSAFAVAGLVGPAAALAATPSAPPPIFGLFGVDVSDLVGDVVKGVFDVLVPDFASKWATQLVAWMVAVPDVSNTKTFPELNAFQQQLLAVGFGLVGIGFVAAALQYLAAGITGRMNAVDAFQRSAVACGMLVFYPKLMGIATVGTNLLTDAIVTAPRITKGIDTMLGAAFVLAVATGGFSVGMAVGAAAACLWFLAGIFVMKIAITAAMAILLLSGGIVLGLHAFAPLSWLPRLWSSVLVAVHAIPIAWALIFAAAALLTSDSLIFNQGLGASLEAAVKPFVAVACLYLAYKAPAFLLAAARTMGVNMTGLAPAMGGGRGSGGAGGRMAGVGAAAGAGGPGGNVARRALQTHGDRMRGLRAAISARSAAPVARVRQAVSQGASSASSAAKRAAAPVAVNAAAALGPADGSGRARALSGASNGAKKTGTAVRGAARGAATGARAVRSANDWWRTQLPQKGAQLRNGVPGTPATSASRQGADGAAAGRGSGDDRASASARRPASREKTNDVTRTANGNGARDGAQRTQAPPARTPRTPTGAGAGARPAVPTGPSGSTSSPANGKAATAPSTSAPGPVVPASGASGASGAPGTASAARAQFPGIAAAATKAAADKPGKPKPPPPAVQTTSDRPTPRPPRSN